MIELTQEQVNALAMPDAGPACVVNPATQEKYILVPLADYDRLLHEESYHDSPWTDEERDLLRVEACEMLDS